MQKPAEKETKIIPIGDNLVLEPIKDEMETTKSGIYLPQTTDKKPPVMAKVIAIGDKVEVFEPGDTVIFVEYGFEPIKLDDREFMVGPAEKVLAIIK